jgi:uncharacterized protein (DUF58 family)
VTPTTHLLILWGALAALALAVQLAPLPALLWPGAAALACALALADFLLGRRPPELGFSRELRHSLPVGVWSPVGLRLENPGGRTLELMVHDHHPAVFDAESLPARLRLPAGRAARLHYRVRPQRRGDAEFAGVELSIRSPLGLWCCRRFLPRPERVKVFPNFREISHYALLATDNHLSRMGVRRRQRRGEGNDFRQLREYRAGDAIRQIDWKATSRSQKLISKEYQDERDQQVLFLLDCGRRMRHEEEGRAHLDQVLNAMLLLAYVAARQGDAVGFMAFGGQRRWYPPRKQGDVVRELLEQLYDLQSTSEAADYLMAAKELLPRQRRRALVILLTNSRDEDGEELRQAVQLLAARHLVVLADLRETLLDEALRQRVRDLDGALRFHAVNEYLAERARSHDLLRHHGALTLDLTAPQLPTALVNQYLGIKASGRL